MPNAPRWGEVDWWVRYLDDVRPRLLWLRLEADKVRIRWGVPVWALEESLRALLLLGPWVLWFARHLPIKTRAKASGEWGRGRFRLDLDLSGEPGPAPWHTAVALLEGAGEGMLRLPSGEPFVHVEAGDGVRIQIVSY
ncbi:MAG: hypothetical protein ACNA8N_01675 [Trueperaceae bacterium]